MIGKSVLTGVIATLSLLGNKAFSQTKHDSTHYSGFPNYDPIVEFPGGNDGLKKFITSNLKKADGAAGKRVIVSFIIKPDGTPTDFRVARGINAAADSESLRVIRLSPKWKYTPQNGSLHNVAYSLPITFD